MRRWLRAGGKDWLLLMIAAAVFLAALIAPLAIAAAAPPSFGTEHMIRIHIAAHSDAPYDQTVKLAVRDTLTETFQPLFADLCGKNNAYAMKKLQECLPAIHLCAQKRLTELGCSKAVLAEAGRLMLPEKSGASGFVPAGEYDALVITIGSGRGKNWWCALFPELSMALAGEQTPVMLECVRQRAGEILQLWLLKGE